MVEATTTDKPTDDNAAAGTTGGEEEKKDGDNNQAVVQQSPSSDIMQKKALIEKRLEETGEKARLEEYLKQRLIESGWRDELKKHCLGKFQFFGMSGPFGSLLLFTSLV